MDRTPVILGLTRQAKLWGLPMPYTLCVASLTMLPFIWLDSLSWLFTGPFWYAFARMAAVANPNGAQVLRVVLTKTPPSLTRSRKKGRRYVQQSNRRS